MGCKLSNKTYARAGRLIQKRNQHSENNKKFCSGGGNCQRNVRTWRPFFRNTLHFRNMLRTICCNADRGYGC